jgi:hypothetical protein
MAIKRQNIILSLLFGLALVSISAAAEVRFVDERPENARQIERYVSRTDGKAISADSLVDLLNRQGYLDAVVELNSSIVTINVGQRSHLARFEISGDTICSIDASGPFTQLNLEESMRSVQGIDAVGAGAVHFRWVLLRLRQSEGAYPRRSGRDGRR